VSWNCLVTVTKNAVDRLITLAEATPRTFDVEMDALDRVFNIGGTEVVSCHTVAEMCLEYLNCAAHITYNRSKPTGVTTRRTDQRKFARTFGIQIETTIDEGFGLFLDWLLSL
jgi:nucleoside-diphosphate-sugar epimerase